MVFRIKINWLVFFSSFAGDSGCHRRWRRKEKENAFQIYPLCGLCMWWRVNPRAANGDGAWRRRPVIVPADPRRCSQQFMEFWGLFCIFFNCIWFILNLIILEHVKMMYEFSIVKSNVWVCVFFFVFFMYVLKMLK